MISRFRFMLQIVVRRKINSEIKISPPGPDFAIVEFIPTELTQTKLDTRYVTTLLLGLSTDYQLLIYIVGKLSTHFSSFIILIARHPIGPSSNDLITFNSWMTRELSNDLRVTVDQLRHDDGTMSVTVNSTLCSHLGAKEPTGERLIVTGSSSKRGKALLLCNKEGRRDWKIQYDDALHILGQQFGMQVRLNSNVSTHK